MFPVPETKHAFHLPPRPVVVQRDIKRMESIVSISTSAVLALIVVKKIWNALTTREITHVQTSVNKGWKDL